MIVIFLKRVKSFLVTGISNKLDRTEDDEFQGFK